MRKEDEHARAYNVQLYEDMLEGGGMSDRGGNMKKRVERIRRMGPNEGKRAS